MKDFFFRSRYNRFDVLVQLSAVALILHGHWQIALPLILAAAVVSAYVEDTV